MEALGLALINKYLIDKPSAKMSLTEFKDLFNTEGPHYIAKHDIPLSTKRISKGQRFTPDELSVIYSFM